MKQIAVAPASAVRILDRLVILFSSPSGHAHGDPQRSRNARGSLKEWRAPGEAPHHQISTLSA